MVPPRTYLPDLDIAREQIIMQCLRTDPTARFQSAQEVASSLLAPNDVSSDRAQRYHSGKGLPTDRERLKPGSSSDVPKGDGVSASAAHASGEHKRRRYVVLGACVGLLAAGSLAHSIWFRSNTPSRPSKVTQISQWNKPMYDAHLSPDGHAVAIRSADDRHTPVFEQGSGMASSSCKQTACGCRGFVYQIE